MARKILESLYRSPVGRLMSIFGRLWATIKQPYMIYGFYDLGSSEFRKYTRLSDSVVIINRNRLSLGDNVWVWHYSILDASEGLTIEEGCQIGAWVGVFTHGSQISIRLHGRSYVNIPSAERIGYTRGSVKIGAYSFIGAGAIILPNVMIGKGCIVGAGSVVNKNIPDYAIVQGSPAKIIGSTKNLDKSFLHEQSIMESYYDQELLKEILLEEKN
jgi:acetyltransferase-like isoleucine patch superfamily enzyme